MTTTATIRITPRSHQALKELAKAMGKPMQTVLERAIETYRRERFWDACDAAYAKLRKDPKVWAEVLQERASMEGTLSDGLEED